MPKVRFHTADRKLSLNNKGNIKSFIESIFIKENCRLFRLNYIFCSDEFLLNINRDFLKHDFYTDIITFNLSENDDIVGEVYISIDRVKENAATLNLSFADEMLRVLFHGALHLCGYNDKKKHERVKIREREDTYLLLFNNDKNKRST